LKRQSRFYFLIKRKEKELAILGFLGATGAVLFFIWLSYHLFWKKRKVDDKKELQKKIFVQMALTSKSYSFIELVETYNVLPATMKSAIKSLEGKGLIKTTNKKYLISKFGEDLFNGFIKGKTDGLKNLL
jgi:hypothetical protein